MEAYQGSVATIPLGVGGLYTDSPQTLIPLTHLVKAENVTFRHDLAEKDFGSRRWNSTALSSGIKQFADFWTDPNTQRVIVVQKNGLVYRFPNYYTSQLVAASGVAPTALNPANYCQILIGGNEESGRSKKAFIFTGNDPVQVISGDTAVRTNIANGPADWTGTRNGIGGIIYRNRMFAWGGDPNRIYASLATDHENFTSSPLSFSVFPGEGERFVGGAIFAGRLFVGKYPKGVYYLVDSDSSSTNWYFQKFSDKFGFASPNCATGVLDDFLIANSFGNITSMKTAQVFGDFTTSEVFHSLKAYKYVENNIRLDEVQGRHMLYDAGHKTVYATFQSTSNYYYDRICVLDFKQAPQSPPKISWITKDAPNCLATVKDDRGIERPFYGADDGYIYQLGVTDRWVGDTVTQTGYTFDIELPHTDFSEADPKLGSYTKQYDFLEVEYEATGDWNLNIDVYVDGKFLRTLTCNMSGLTQLDQIVLNVNRLDADVPFSRQLPLNALGKRIGFRLYNSGAGENVRLIRLRILYMIAGQQQQQTGRP